MAPNANSSAARKNAGSKPDQQLVDDVRGRTGFLGDTENHLDALGRGFIAKSIEDGVRLMTASVTTWEAFCSEPFWDDHPKRRPKASGQADAVKHVVRMHYGEHPYATRRTSEIWTAFRCLMEEGVTAADLPAKIAAGESIRTICDRAAHKKKVSAPAEPSSAKPGKPHMQKKASRADRVPPDSPKPEEHKRANKGRARKYVMVDFGEYPNLMTMQKGEKATVVIEFLAIKKNGRLRLQLSPVRAKS